MPCLLSLVSSVGFLALTFTFDGTNFLSRYNARAGDAVASKALPSSKAPIFSTIRRKDGGRGKGRRKEGEGGRERRNERDLDSWLYTQGYPLALSFQSHPVLPGVAGHFQYDLLL